MPRRGSRWSLIHCLAREDSATAEFIAEKYDIAPAEFYDRYSGYSVAQLKAERAERGAGCPEARPPHDLEGAQGIRGCASPHAAREIRAECVRDRRPQMSSEPRAILKAISARTEAEL